MKSLKTSVLCAATAIALCVCAFQPARVLAQTKDGNEPLPSTAMQRILISWNLDFTSNTTADGTSTLAGAISDTGSRHEEFTVNVQGDRAIVTGTITIHATHGDLTEQFVGTIPVGPNPTQIEGTGIFTGGTGAYAGVTGRATFEGTVNFATGKLVGVTEGKVALSR